MTAPSEPQVYLNGQFLARSQAKLDIEDRGALFGDGVYEVMGYHAGRPFAIQEHLARLRHSLTGIRLRAPSDLDRFEAISDRLIANNGLANANLYWQVTRGSATRNPVMPKDTAPTVLAIAYPTNPLDPHAKPKAVSAMLLEDQRWRLCWIKSLMLLPNVLAKAQAMEAGADEAILYRQGRVTESTSANVLIVHQGQLWTHPADQWILGGITRRVVLGLASQRGITIQECTYTPDQLLEADEVMLCGTTTPIAGVVEVNQRRIGDGQAGPITTQLHAALVKQILQSCAG